MILICPCHLISGVRRATYWVNFSVFQRDTAVIILDFFDIGQDFVPSFNSVGHLWIRWRRNNGNGVSFNKLLETKDFTDVDIFELLVIRKLG